MGVLRTIGVFGLGMGVTLAVVRANNPEVAEKTLSDIGSTTGQIASVGGYAGGEVLRSTGPVIAGAKAAAQQSGLGEMLSSDTVPPANQPNPEP
jgi:hypothetical protein